MGVEPGGHFCPAKQLIEGDGNFQISRWKKILDLSFFCIKSISWWSVDSACLWCDSSNQLRPGRVPKFSVNKNIFARSAYYVPLAHQEPASAARRAPPPPASGQISKCPKNGPPETDLRAEIPGSRVPFLVHFWDLTKYVSWRNLIQLYSYCTLDDKKKPK